MLPKIPTLPITPCLTNPSQEEIHAYFQASWNLYEWLFSGIIQQEEIFRLQPNPFRNTLGFYFGHTAAFYVQKLRMSGLLDEGVNDAFDKGLERGVWPKSAQEISARQDWPDLTQLKAYRQQVYDKVSRVIETATFDAPISDKHPLWALMMAIEHECIHFQTSIPLIRRVPVERLSSPEGWGFGRELENDRASVEPEWVSCAGGHVKYGRDHAEHEYFGWDNEFGVTQTQLAPFQVMNLPITNARFLEFVEAGGYQDPALWQTNEVSVWFEEMSPTHPASWIKKPEGGFAYRDIFNEREMPWDAPVEVNRHEAAAFAKWAGGRLLKEAEFHKLLQEDFGGPREIVKQLDNYNVNLKYSTPLPVGIMPETLGNRGLDLVGNVSRWAEEDFQPLDAENFRAHALYEDFSKPWFRGDHGVLLGAGYTSVGHVAQAGLMRDFMQNHMDQIAGITLVKPA